MFKFVRVAWHVLVCMYVSVGRSVVRLSAYVSGFMGVFASSVCASLCVCSNANTRTRISLFSRPRLCVSVRMQDRCGARDTCATPLADKQTPPVSRIKVAGLQAGEADRERVITLSAAGPVGNLSVHVLPPGIVDYRQGLTPQR